MATPLELTIIVDPVRPITHLFSIVAQEFTIRSGLWIFLTIPTAFTYCISAPLVRLSGNQRNEFAPRDSLDGTPRKQASVLLPESPGAYKSGSHGRKAVSRTSEGCPSFRGFFNE